MKCLKLKWNLGNIKLVSCCLSRFQSFSTESPVPLTSLQQEHWTIGKIKILFVRPFGSSYKKFRCKVPECEDIESGSFITDWLNLSTPFDSTLPEKCERFAPLTDNTTENSCTVESFNRSINVKCKDYVYEDDEVTILNEVCKGWV